MMAREGKRVESRCRRDTISHAQGFLDGGTRDLMRSTGESGDVFSGCYHGGRGNERQVGGSRGVSRGKGAESGRRAKEGRHHEVHVGVYGWRYEGGRRREARCVWWQGGQA